MRVGSAVSWWIDDLRPRGDDGPRSAGASNASAIAGSTPRARSAAALSSLRAQRRDLVAGREQLSISGRPIAPVAPATKTLIGRPPAPSAWSRHADSSQAVAASSAASETASNAPTQPGSASPMSTMWLTRCSAH